MSWSATILVLGLVAALLMVAGFTVASRVELRKIKVSEHQHDELRRLVQRYEQLAEKTLDAQQRTATDVADLRARATSIEQILRTVE
jgi:hypothetical protein